MSDEYREPAALTTQTNRIADEFQAVQTRERLFLRGQLIELLHQETANKLEVYKASPEEDHISFYVHAKYKREWIAQWADANGFACHFERNHVNLYWGDDRHWKVRRRKLYEFFDNDHVKIGLIVMGVASIVGVVVVLAAKADREERQQLKQQTECPYGPPPPIVVEEPKE